MAVPMWGLLAGGIVLAFLYFKPAGGTRMPWIQRNLIALVAALVVGVAFDYEPNRGRSDRPACPEIGVCARPPGLPGQQVPPELSDLKF